MKKTLSVFPCLAIALIVSFTSCEKAKEKINIDLAMQMVELEFTIQPQAAGTYTLAEFDSYLNVDSIIRDASPFDISNIKSVKVESCELEILNADETNNFGAVSAFNAALSTNTQPVPVTIASIPDNPDTDVDALDMPINTEVDLKNYFNSTLFQYTISGTLRREITSALNCKARVKFNVTIGL